MATQLIPVPAELASERLQNSALAGAADNDVFAGTQTLRAITLDNLSGAAAAYYKAADAAALTVGTTSPDLQCRVSGGSQLVIAFGTGYVLGTGWSQCAVTGAEVAAQTAASPALVLEAIAG